MKTFLVRLIPTLLLGLLLPVAAKAVTRTVTITTPSTPVTAGQSVSIPTFASTDAGGGEQLGFYHVEYSTNGGSSWTGAYYDVNVGSSATRTVNLTAGAAGSTIVVRVRIAFRGGAAGDVDYNGGAINWSGSWDSWGTPPTVYASFTVSANRNVGITTPSTSVTAGQQIAVPVTASTDAGGGEQIGFLHVEYSTNGGSSWTAVAYDQNVGTSATRTANITAGAAGSVIVVRARVAFRYGAAGDVDYNGGAINWSGSWNNWGTPPTKYAYITVATTRTVTISSPGTIYAGQSVTIPTSAFTDGPGGEQLGFYHLEYSANGGGSWTAVAYDQNVGTSATRNVNLTAGAAGSTITVRVKIAFRGGSAGDVDYAGGAIDWSGSWGNWGTPPTKYQTFNVVPNEVLLGTASASVPYHVKAAILKDGHATDPQAFGDGVILEVFKRTGSTDTVLWSSLLARKTPASQPVRINLSADLVTGDKIYYRLVSHTNDVAYDTVTFQEAFVFKTAALYPNQGSISPSQNQSDIKTGAINALLTAAVNEMNSPTTTNDRAVVTLPAGTYYVNDSGAGHGEALLAINDAKNVTLRGPGAKIVIVPNSDGTVTPKMFLTSANSTNIEVGDLEFDYVDAALPFIQGIVTYVDGNSVTVDLTWEPAHKSRFANGLFCFKYDPANTAKVVGEFKISDCSITNDIATLTLSEGSLAVNDPVVLAIRGPVSKLQEAALRINSSTDTTLRDITLRAGGWIAMIGKGNNGLHFVRYNIERAPGSNRFITTNGDGLQLKNSRRGPTVHNCHFERLLDDGLNLHASIYPASSVGTNTFTAAADTVQVGDVLQVFERNTNDEPWHDGQALYYQTHYPVTAVNGTTVTVSGTLPATANYYVNVSASGEGFLIRHSTIEKTRFRGALIQTGYGYIYDNDFLDNFWSALSFEANLGPQDSVEGAYPHHTPVVSNYFTGNLYSQPASGRKAIGIWGHDMNMPPAPMFEKLAAEIKNNTFQQQTADPVSVLTGSETFNASANTIVP